VLGFFRARQRGRDARAAIAAAEAIVAEELVAARGGALETAELAELLGVSHARAEELVAEVQVERMLDDGARMRVEEAEHPTAELDAKASLQRREGRE